MVQCVGTCSTLWDVLSVGTRMAGLCLMALVWRGWALLCVGTCITWLRFRYLAPDSGLSVSIIPPTLLHPMPHSSCMVQVRLSWISSVTQPCTFLNIGSLLLVIFLPRTPLSLLFTVFPDPINRVSASLGCHSSHPIFPKTTSDRHLLSPLIFSLLQFFDVIRLMFLADLVLVLGPALYVFVPFGDKDWNLLSW